jgi:hypothetical protein
VAIFDGATREPDVLFGCLLENFDGLYIDGFTHGGTVYTSFAPDGAYQWVQEYGRWGWMVSLVDGQPGECWNESGGKVYIDGCRVDDGNEYWEFVPCPSSTYCIKNYTETTKLNLSADRYDGDVYFSDGVNNTSEWTVWEGA